MQKEVSHILLNYLASNNSLALEGIGRFNKHYRPAHFVGNQLKAPGSLLYFEVDKSLKSSDVSLLQVWKAYDLEEKASITALQAVFEEVNNEISQQKTFRYTGLGTFERNGARIEFHPDPELYLDTYGYGLESVLTHAISPVPSATIQTIAPKQEVTKKRTADFWLKVAAAVLFLLVANFAVFYFLEQNQSQIQQADLSSYDSLVSSNTIDTNITIESIPEEKIIAPEIQSESAAVEAALTIPTPVKATAVSPTSGNYFIIVGAFRDLKNAEKYIQELKNTGYPEAVAAGSTNSGLHRVAVAKFTNQEMAEAYLEEIKRKLQADAWLMN